MFIDTLIKIVKVYNNLTYTTIGLEHMQVNKENEKKWLKSVFKYTPPDLMENSKI